MLTKLSDCTLNVKHLRTAFYGKPLLSKRSVRNQEATHFQSSFHVPPYFKNSHF